MSQLLASLQVASHAHASRQSTWRHAPSPVHVTWHAPVPQVTLAQAFAPLQVI
jgi:hypothetical protein